jgi:VacB/RNase II family 3'-5' exoribonuclease
MTDAPRARPILQDVAYRVMVSKGLAPDFSPAALAELNAIHGPAPAQQPGVRDLRSLLWCSIDNDDSRDLDQLSVAETLPDGNVRILVAIADVAVVVALRSAIDGHARQNTTSVYTAARIFPMLPEKLSTDLTSLGFGVDRRAMVIDMTFAADASITRSDIYEAAVHNRAKLAYNSVAAWLDGNGPVPAPIPKVPGLDENIRLQHRVAQQLRARRHEHGALSLETVQARPVFEDGTLTALEAEHTNSAKKLIEDLMIAANGISAQFLAKRHLPSLRRIVRTPKRWDRIVELALAHGGSLPSQPDAPALQRFLVTARQSDPAHFADLSLSVIKLIGAGEYVVELPGQTAPGHFGLAVKDYAHSTAPNRRFPDLITQRLLKAAIAGQRPPFPSEELMALAAHCTEQEDAAKKVERQVAKSAAALLLRTRIGETFTGLVTGAAEKGTWVRLTLPPVEGKVISGGEGWDVGQRVRVRLVHADVERGFLDFVGAH